MILRKKLATSVLGGVVLTFCVLPKANAIFPTFDIAEVAQTISSACSQVQSVLNSAQSTIAQVNIQQSIGDALGGLSKFKNVEKLKEKAEKAAKKAQAAKQRYEDAKKKYEDAKQQVTDTINNAKEQANNLKGQVEDTVNQVKNGYDQAINTYEQVKDDFGAKVNEFKDTVEGYETQAEKVIDKINGQDGENVAVSGMQTQIFDVDENALDDVSIDDLWNSPDTFEPSPAKQMLPKKTMDQAPVNEKNPDFERTSFKKVSYLQNLPAAFAAESSGFAYGVNTDTGRFVISNTMAEWCGINFDEEDENVIAECIKTMVMNMHDKDSAVAAEYRKKFEQVKKETLEAMIVIAAINSSYSGGFEESVSKDLESKSDATDTVRDNIAYLSEVERANQEIQRRMLDVQPIALMYQTLEAIETLDKDVYDEE